MFTRIYDNLRPGGWAEFQDAVFEPVGEDPAADDFVRHSTYARYFQGLCAGGMAHGRDFRAPYHFKEWMIEAGFVDVVKLTILVPLNAWPLNPEDKMIGNWFCLNVLKFLDGSSKLLEAGGMPRDEIPGFLDKVRENLTDLRLRGYTERELYSLFLLYCEGLSAIERKKGKKLRMEASVVTATLRLTLCIFRLCLLRAQTGRTY